MTKVLVKYYNKNVFLQTPELEDTKIRLVEELLMESSLSLQEMFITDHFRTAIALASNTNEDNIIILSTNVTYF